MSDRHLAQVQNILRNSIPLGLILLADVNVFPIKNLQFQKNINLADVYQKDETCYYFIITIISTGKLFYSTVNATI